MGRSRGASARPMARRIAVAVLLGGCGLAVSACGIVRPILPPNSSTAMLPVAGSIPMPVVGYFPIQPPATIATPPALPTVAPRPAVVATPRPAPAPQVPAIVERPRVAAVPAPAPVVVHSSAPAPAPVVVHPAPAPVPVSVPVTYAADHLVGPGVNILVTPMAPYNCDGFSPPLPTDRAVIDPCAQPVTGVPLIDGHNWVGLMWNASTTWVVGTVVHWGGHTWQIVHAQVVNHYITYYPMPVAGAGLQIRTCQPDGLTEWVWDLDQIG